MPGTDQPLRNWAASTDADTVGRAPPSSRMPGDVDVSVHVLGTLTRMRRVVSVSCTVPGGIVLPASVTGTVVEVEVVATLAVGNGSVGPGSVLAGHGAAGPLAGAAPTAAAVPATHTRERARHGDDEAGRSRHGPQSWHADRSAPPPVIERVFGMRERVLERANRQARSSARWRTLDGSDAPGG